MGYSHLDIPPRNILSSRTFDVLGNDRNGYGIDKAMASNTKCLTLGRLVTRRLIVAELCTFYSLALSYLLSSGSDPHLDEHEHRSSSSLYTYREAHIRDGLCRQRSSR
jgi:hypothetical protein